MEQGEFLRVAWRMIVAEKVEEGPKSACAKGLGCFYSPSFREGGCSRKLGGISEEPEHPLPRFLVSPLRLNT